MTTGDHWRPLATWRPGDLVTWRPGDLLTTCWRLLLATWQPGAQQTAPHTTSTAHAHAHTPAAPMAFAA
eukprot:3237573-Prymnesium_polylepis.1